MDFGSSWMENSRIERENLDGENLDGIGFRGNLDGESGWGIVELRWRIVLGNR